MRRPRGPGGRFLTAEEIAAQKAGEHPSPLNANDDGDDDMDEDDLPIDLHQPQPPPPPTLMQPSQLQQASQSEIADQSEFLPPQDPISMINIAYQPMAIAHPQIHPMSHQPQQLGQGSKALTQANVMYNPPQVQQVPVQIPTPHHNSKGTTNSAPITLSSPYATPVQMHHVPHPHAHARHHHSNVNYTQGLYGAENVASAELQRRTEEMLQYNAGAASAS